MSLEELPFFFMRWGAHISFFQDVHAKTDLPLPFRVSAEGRFAYVTIVQPGPAWGEYVQPRMEKVW